jgi:membrane protease YdiL (CAAX protease family)
MNSVIQKHEAPFALIYCAVILTLMEYFFIPPRADAWFSGGPFKAWRPPSLDAGLLWSVSCLVMFFLIPCWIVKMILKLPLQKFGLSTEDFWPHLKTYLLLYLLMTPLIYLAATQPEFSHVYPFVSSAKKSFGTFLIWESAYILQFFALEFFFRGYLLFTLEKHMAPVLAIAVMVVPYTMIHFHKPFPETFGAIVAGCVLGFLSLRYRSWLGGAILHSLVALTLDSLSAYQAGLF